MSETQYEEPVYVVNQRREGGLAMVHMPDCRTIRHQVEQDIRDEYPRWDYEPVGTDGQGDQIYERTLLFDIQRFQAVYVTRSSLLASGLHDSNTLAPTRNDERFRTADHPERNASLPVDDFEKLFSCRQWFGISGARKPRT